ncbi:MAG TPA: hypothetical protein PKV56_06490 [Burkholderiaceae bacterium]|nr:hypothetical protein [Burkholderiaceae bacterium]
MSTHPMTPERFEQFARQPARTREELETMRANALAKGNVELAHIAAEVLAERFPTQTKQRSGPTQTTAAFLGRSETFGTGKEAYLWLLERFRQHQPLIFEAYELLRHKDRSAGTRVAKDPALLFPRGSSRIGNPANYATLTGGWYADTNLNHQDKFSTLVRFAHLAKLEYPEDWDFRVEGGTMELRKQQDLVIQVRELLRELGLAN